MTACPNCGYHADRSTVAHAGTPADPLNAFPEGAVAVITAFRSGTGPAEAATLAGLGLLPGVRIVVVRRYPSIMVRIGHRTVALDGALAHALLVRKAE